MKTILAVILSAVSVGALAQGSPLEIRFYPSERIYAYPLDEQARYRSVHLQNAVVINRSNDAIALAEIDLELVAPPSAVETRQFEGDELDRMAKAGHMLRSSGLMEALRFQFGGEALAPKGIAFARGAVLQPAATALLAIQSTGAQAELKAGHMVLERLPTAENFASFAAGVSKAPALPEGIRARVSYRLDRGPGEMATLTISSYTVDADERMIYKVYPDVVAEFIESGPVRQNASTTLVSRQEDKGQDARTLTMTRWHSVQ